MLITKLLTYLKKTNYLLQWLIIWTLALNFLMIIDISYGLEAYIPSSLIKTVKNILIGTKVNIEVSEDNGLKNYTREFRSTIRSVLLELQSWRGLSPARNLRWSTIPHAHSWFHRLQDQHPNHRLHHHHHHPCPHHHQQPLLLPQLSFSLLHLVLSSSWIHRP